jgi:hypothetical protein
VTNNTNKPEPESLRVQLTELNNRSRWYSAELWQIPFAYLGLTGLIIVQIADKTPRHLGLAFITAAVFGVFVIIHMFKIRKHEIRAVEDLQETEAKLNLKPTAKSSSGLKVFQIAVLLAVIAFAFTGLYLFFKERCDKSTIKQKTTIETNSANEEHSSPNTNGLKENDKKANKSVQ